MKYILSTLFLTCFLFTSTISQAQSDALDLNGIKERTHNRHSGFFYPNLMKRYQQNDTTLNTEEYKHLYYGYIFQEGYNPYRTSPVATKIDSLYHSRDGIISDTNCEKLIKYAHQSLDNFPFELGYIHLLMKGYKYLERPETEKIWFHKLKGLVGAIGISGDGGSMKTAWVVIHPSNEYDLLNILGFTAKKHTFKEPYYDYIELDKNDSKLKGLYFKVKLMLDEYDRKYK